MESKKFPIAMPFGGGGNKDLIKVSKDRDRNYLNTIAISRFSIEDGTDISIILDIAGDDPKTISFIESLCAASFAEDGRSRGEQIMMMTGMIAPGSMPGRNGHDDDRNIKRRKKDKREQNQEYEDDYEQK